MVAHRCHGPECSRSRRVTGSYGRSTGIGDLVDTSREHGHSAVSMETMDSYGLTCKGGLGPYARRARHSHEEDQAQGACRQLPLRGSRDKSQRNRHQSKEKEQCIGNQQAGPEEEEQCRRSRHHSRGTGGQAGEAPEQYSMKKVLSGERAGAASLAMLRRGI